jgi:hypothetical protein
MYHLQRDISAGDIFAHPANNYHPTSKLSSTARSRGGRVSVLQLAAIAATPSRAPRSYNMIARISAVAWSSTSFTSAYL